LLYHRRVNVQAEVLTLTNKMNRNEWLDSRRVGIGGSDAGAIAGLNKWKSPVQVYLEKVGEAPKEDVKNEAVYWGNVMEDIVAKEFQKRTGMKVRRRNAILQHPEHPFMLANVDRLIVGKREGLECKTASEFLKDKWTDDEVPPSYLLQCQHYMAVTGYEAWWIAVLIGGNKFVYKKIERDDELINYLIQIEKDFWNNHVEKKIPPAFDGSDASKDLLNSMYPEAMKDTSIELSDDALTFIEALDQVKAEIKELETQKKEYENKLKALIGENEKAYAGERVITWKTIHSNRFDLKKFEKEHPDLFNKYTKQSSYRRLQVK